MAFLCLIDFLFNYLAQFLLTLIKLFVSIYFVFYLIRKLLFKGVISSDGKAVLITGCASGFGNGLAKRLSQLGFRVYATVRSTTSPGAEELKSNPSFADKVIVLQMNVTNDCEVNEVYEKVQRDLQSSGHVLWAVVNNAGIFICSPLEWASLDTYRQTFEINVLGMVRVTRVFLPLIRASKGRIINVASISGRFPMSPFGIYGMSKSSAVAFTETLRREMNRFGVKVSSIEPGLVRTPILQTQNLVNQLKNSWDQCSDQVKQSYGNQEQAKKVAIGILTMMPVLEDIDIIVDDMIHSIVSRWPKAVYGARGILYKSFLYCNMLLPSSLINQIVSVFESFVSMILE